MIDEESKQVDYDFTASGCPNAFSQEATHISQADADKLFAKAMEMVKARNTKPKRDCKTLVNRRNLGNSG